MRDASSSGLVSIQVHRVKGSNLRNVVNFLSSKMGQFTKLMRFVPPIICELAFAKVRERKRKSN